jgi:hypothetical protein
MMKVSLAIVWFVILSSLGACASVPRTGPNNVPPGAHRVAQVITVGKRSEILGTPIYKLFTDGGISDALIVDGSGAVAIVYCCGEKYSGDTSIVFYSPPGLKLEPRDVVELKMGKEPNGSEYGTVNTALAIRAEPSDFAKQCRWVPRDDHEGTSLQLWRRTIYCDWMPQEGWTEIDTIHVHTWFKPPG